MPTYSKKTWSSQEVVTSTGLNQMSDNTELCLRGVGSNKKFATGRKSMSVNGTSFSGTVTFATDADDGDPGFSATPRVVITLELSTGGAFLVNEQRVTTISSTSFSFEFNFESSYTTTMYLNWIAIGS